MNRRWLSSRWILVGLVSTAVSLTGCAIAQSPKDQTVSDTAEHMAMSSEITVFRSPACGCCGLWIEHMEAAGFTVKDNMTEGTTAIKEQYGIPANLASCHTTLISGYVVEDHIPAEDVKRLLAEKPEIAGMAVPGMPIGSPGMESGKYVEPYTVFSFSDDGTIDTFAEHS